MYALVTTAEGLSGPDTNGFVINLNTTGANFIAIWTCSLAGVTVTGNKGETYIPAEAILRGQWWYAYNVAGGSGHQITIGGTGIFAAARVYAFGGLDFEDDPFLAQVTLTNEGAELTNFCNTVTGIDPPVDGCLVLGGTQFEGFFTQGTYEINSGFGNFHDHDTVDGQSYGYGTGFIIQGSPVSYNNLAPIASWVTSVLTRNALIAFIPGTGSPIPSGSGSLDGGPLVLGMLD